MDPMTLVVTAFATGATVALKSTAEQAIKDAYASFKDFVLRKLGTHGDVAKAIADFDSKPESKGRKETLKEELSAAGAEHDEELVKKAIELLQLIEKEAPNAVGNVRVNTINAAGGQVVVTGANYGSIEVKHKG